MPLPVNHGNNLRRQFLARQLSTTSANSVAGLQDYQLANAKKWISRYRRNWDLFVEEVLGIKLYPIQKFKIHMMGVADVYDDMSTRGSAKSFLVGLGAICEFCLKSYAEVVITSSTIPQASKLVEKKIRDEIIKKLSPYLLYMYKKEYIVITKSSSSDGGTYTIENKLNGSTIKVMACLDSSRGERATFLIFDECRLLKKTIVDSVFIPMSHNRPTKYSTNREYNKKRWIEPAKSVYISSARYKYEWFWNKYKDVVTNYYNSKHENYIALAEDIYAAIWEGSRTWADYRINKRQLSSMDFAMEVENQMIGEAEDAFFNYQQFKESQVLTTCFKPTNVMQWAMQEESHFVEKQTNEVRIVAADFAFTETKGSNESDYTQFICMSAHWKDGFFERHIDYAETWPANDDDGAVIRLKQLFCEYDADYITPDVRNGGENLIVQFSKPQESEYGMTKWINRGFGMANESQYHIASSDKIDYYRARAIDKNYIPCIIPFVGSATTNTAYWRAMKRSLDRKMFKMLISMQDKQTKLEDSGQYFDMTSEQVAEELAPFGQGDLMIKEAVELSMSLTANGNIKLTEPRSGHKDRIVTACMGNYVIDLIEADWAKRQSTTDIDLESIELVF